MPMTTEQRVLYYLKQRSETSHMDFKLQFYEDCKQSDFAKDVAAFANLCSGLDKLLIFGVEDRTTAYVGIDPTSLPDNETLNNILAELIEPTLRVESGLMCYKDVVIGYVCIPGKGINPPYLIKETCGKGGKIEQGDIYLRKGTSNKKATRTDLDNIRRWATEHGQNLANNT